MHEVFPVLVASLFDRTSRVLIVLTGMGPMQEWVRRMTLGQIVDRTAAQGDGPYVFGAMPAYCSEYGGHWPEAVKMLTDYCHEAGLRCAADELTAMGKTDVFGGEVEVYRAQVRLNLNDAENQ